jgi:tRNA(Ile)-lysidine synthase
MLERFKQIVTTMSVNGKPPKVIVASSGGLDSTVMAHLCKSIGLTFALAHCNFKLRNIESDEDEVFVNNLAKELDVSFFSISFDTIAESEKKSKSIQLTARDLRYEWFDDLLLTHKYDYLFAAHHLNDRVETTIFNLLRGAGIAGLRSIKQVNGTIARPLLSFTRQEIELYAMVNSINWREDSSNASKKYTRNYIRHEIIPHFDEVHPNWQQAISHTYERLEQSEKILKSLAQTLYLQLANGQLSRAIFYKTCTQAILLEMALKDQGITWEQATYFLNEIASNKHPIQIKLDEFILAADAEYIYYTEIKEENTTLVYIEKPGDSASYFNTQIDCFVIDKSDFKLLKNNQYAYFDVEKISFPLLVNSWKKGDLFQPFGFNGKKKISDLLIDLKIPRHLKYEVPMVRNAQNEILWVAGYRQSNKYIITAQTHSILCLKIT